MQASPDYSRKHIQSMAESHRKLLYIIDMHIWVRVLQHALYAIKDIVGFDLSHKGHEGKF